MSNFLWRFGFFVSLFVLKIEKSECPVVIVSLKVKKQKKMGLY
jgi:hypothetical protein